VCVFNIDYFTVHSAWSMSGLWPIPCSNNIQGGCMPGPLLMATPESDRLHVNCAKMETGLINCRTYPGADCDTDHQLLRLMATLKVRLAKRQHSTSESRGKESSTVCSRGNQQVYGTGGCTEWGHPRRSLQRYQDSPTGGGQRNDWIRQVAKEKENGYLMTLSQHPMEKRTEG